MHEALLKERRSSGSCRQDSFVRRCNSLLLYANSEQFTPEIGGAWWQHCFAGLPRDVEQLLQNRRQLLRQREAAQSAAVAAFFGETNPLEAVSKAASAATAAAASVEAPETQFPKDEAEIDPKADLPQLFNCLVRRLTSQLATPDGLSSTACFWQACCYCSFPSAEFV